MGKKLGWAALVLILVLGGIAFYIYTNSGAIIKAAVERYGSDATQTPVRLSGAKLSLQTGEGSLSGLRIGNPQGYSAGDALSLGEISVAVDPQSVLSTGPIHIREVNINAPKIAYEHSLQTSNLDVLRSNVKAYASRMSRGGDATASGKEGRKIIIDNLYVRNGTVSVSDATLKGAAVDTSLPTIHLSNIGKAKGGATQAEVTQQILTVLTGSAIQAGAGALAGQIGNLGGAAGGAVPSTSGVTDTVKGLFGN